MQCKFSIVSKVVYGMGFSIQNLQPNAQLTIPPTDFPSITSQQLKMHYGLATFRPTNHVFRTSTTHAHSISLCI